MPDGNRVPDGNSGPKKGAMKMKKLLAIGTMVVLMLAAASPAFASTVAVGGDVNVQFVDASQAQFAAALQVNTGNATATASGLSNAAAAEIDQSLIIEQSQWNGGF